jgi:regulator of cell morphogenesis and NO signaling
LVSRLIGDHEEAGATPARIRELTDDYNCPEWACNTTRAIYHSLGEFERCVHQHVHKESNVLFPWVCVAAAEWRNCAAQANRG